MYIEREREREREREYNKGIIEEQVTLRLCATDRGKAENLTSTLCTLCTLCTLGLSNVSILLYFLISHATIYVNYIFDSISSASIIKK